jgi:hypothetical protein
MEGLTLEAVARDTGPPVVHRAAQTRLGAPAVDDLSPSSDMRRLLVVTTTGEGRRWIADGRYDDRGQAAG